MLVKRLLGAAVVSTACVIAWQPATGAPPSFLKRGIVHEGEPSQFAPVIERVLRGEPLTILGLGSSITAIYGGCTRGLQSFCPMHCGITCQKPASMVLDGWMRLVVDADARQGAWVPQQLRRHVNHTIYNGGLGGTSLTLFGECVRHWAPRGVHLAILEFGMLGRGKASVERAVRAVRSLDGSPAVIFANFIDGYHELGGNKHKLGTRLADGTVVSSDSLRFNRSTPVEDMLSELARHYGAALVSARAAVWTALHERGFTLEELTSDGRHPTRRGSALMADMLITLIRRLTSRARRSSPTGAVGARGAHVPPSRPALPAPVALTSERINHECYAFLRDDSRSAGKDLYMLLGKAARLVVDKHGFVFVETEDGGAGRRKPGLIASTPGASARVRVDTRARFSLGQPYVTLAYLTSYEHMGRANVSCARACSCQPVQVDAHATVGHKSVTRALTLHVSPAAACELEVRVLPGTSSGEHKFKLMGLYVGETFPWASGASRGTTPHSVDAAAPSARHSVAARDSREDELCVACLPQLGRRRLQVSRGPGRTVWPHGPGRPRG